jgi:hypothetical protein
MGARSGQGTAWPVCVNNRSATPYKWLAVLHVFRRATPLLVETACLPLAVSGSLQKAAHQSKEGSLALAKHAETWEWKEAKAGRITRRMTPWTTSTSSPPSSAFTPSRTRTARYGRSRPNGYARASPTRSHSRKPALDALHRCLKDRPGHFLRIYKCRKPHCATWHLTHKKQWEKPAIRKQSTSRVSLRQGEHSPAKSA